MGNAIDYKISAFFNSCCRKSELFDRIVSFVSDNHLIKGGVLVLVLWGLWFMRGAEKEIRRQYIVTGLIGTFISMFLVRALPHVLQYRARPLLEPRNHFVIAYGLDRANFDSLSSFPSDHAALFFGLATCIFLASRKWGIWTYLYVLVIIVFPRLYLGLHYATDLIAGALIGVVLVAVMSRKFFREKIGARLLKYETTHPAIFYAVLFLITFGIGEMFTSMRMMASFVAHPYRDISI